MSEKLKLQCELDQFFKFAQLVGLNPKPHQINQPGPPAPDIVFSGDIETVGYELTLATDQDVEQAVRREDSATLWFKADVPSAVKKKLAKRYDCVGPIELVVIESMTPLPHLNIWKQDVEQILGKATNPVFRKIWVMNHKINSVVVSWTWDQERRRWIAR